MSSSKLNLARKYRPSKLEDVMGQPTAIRILSEALKKNRIAPAYLFSGPRGTGKTSCARIFARAVACLEEANRPCGKCRSCLALASGSSMDLLEIDGASHTGVDDVRQIIDAVNYRPAVGARNIYIIDEVHMLSNAAFNALLKTLEEPPPHALFLFATTEPEKIPATILSRVQRVELKRLPEVEIQKNLEMIVKAEGLKASSDILSRIAASADGGLRDAQTLLEQLALLSGGNTLSPDVVEDFLGTIGAHQELDLLEAVALGDAGQCIEKSRQVFAAGKDLVRLFERLVKWSQALLVIKATKSLELLKAEFQAEDLSRIQKSFEKWSIQDVDRLFEVFFLGLERLKHSELPKITLENSFLRACRILSEKALVQQAPQTQSRAPETFHRPSAQQMPHPMISPVAAPPTPSAPPTDLPQLMIALKKKRPQFHALIACAESSEWTKDTLHIRFTLGHFAFKQLSEKILKSELDQLVAEVSSNKCTKVELIEGGAASTKAKTPKSQATDFMSEAKRAILDDLAIQKASRYGKIESVTIEGVKN